MPTANLSPGPTNKTTRVEPGSRFAATKTMVGSATACAVTDRQTGHARLGLKTALV